MSQPGDVPRQSVPPREPDVCIVEQADADLQAHYTRLFRIRDPQLELAAEQLEVAAEDAGDEWVEDRAARQQVSEQLDQATRANNEPTISEPAEPRRRRSRRRER